MGSKYPKFFTSKNSKNEFLYNVPHQPFECEVSRLNVKSVMSPSPQREGERSKNFVFPLNLFFGSKSVFFVILDPDHCTGLAEISGFEGSFFQFEQKLTEL